MRFHGIALLTSAAILGACGGEEEAVSPATEGETPGAVKGAEEVADGTTVAQVEEGAPIARESEVVPGSAVEFTDEELGQQAVLVRLEGGDYGGRGRCPGTAPSLPGLAG